jgi:hypothetical protein
VTIPSTNSGSMPKLDSKHVPGWPRRKSGNISFAVGIIKPTLNARPHATAVNTGKACIETYFGQTLNIKY